MPAVIAYYAEWMQFFRESSESENIVLSSDWPYGLAASDNAVWSWLGRDSDGYDDLRFPWRY
jgi:hypothetical protein